MEVIDSTNAAGLSVLSLGVVPNASTAPAATPPADFSQQLHALTAAIADPQKLAAELQAAGLLEPLPAGQNAISEEGSSSPILAQLADLIARLLKDDAARLPNAAPAVPAVADRVAATPPDESADDGDSDCCQDDASEIPPVTEIVAALPPALSAVLLQTLTVFMVEPQKSSIVARATSVADDSAPSTVVATVPASVPATPIGLIQTLSLPLDAAPVDAAPVASAVAAMGPPPIELASPSHEASIPASEPHEAPTPPESHKPPALSESHNPSMPSDQKWSAPTSSNMPAPATDVSRPESRTLPPHDSLRLVERLGQYLMEARDQGRQLSVRIAPPDLGPLHIEVGTQNGQLTARLETSSTVAQQLLQEHLPQLHEALQHLGANVERIDVVRTEPLARDRDWDRSNGVASGGDWSATSGQSSPDRRDEPRRPTPPPPRSAKVSPASSAAPAIGALQELNIRI